MNENYYGQIGDILCQVHNRKSIISIVFHIWRTNGDFQFFSQKGKKNHIFSRVSEKFPILSQTSSFFFFKDQMLKIGPIL